MQTICSRCILDTTVPELFFDNQGVCQYCHIHDELEKQYPSGEQGKKNLDSLLAKIKKSGKNKKHDCILGVSGGTDSTYTLYQAVKCGLRPLAVHFDNGWDSHQAVKNIKNTCRILNVDLYTYVVDWEEFKDLQISFLKASTPDAEIPTDVGIHAVLIKTAAREGVKYILNGHSFRAEGVSPLGWTYMDGKYINAVQKIFGHQRLKTFPNFTVYDVIYYNFIRGIRVVPFLNYFHYVKEEVKPILEKEVDWKYYGGHHHESIYTKFFQSYLLPQKFKIDKRKTELSALVRIGAITREAALAEIAKEKYPYEPEVVDYTINKLGLKKSEFEIIFNLPIKRFMDYPTYFPLMKLMKLPIGIACRLNILPRLLYLKYLGVS